MHSQRRQPSDGSQGRHRCADLPFQQSLYMPYVTLTSESQASGGYAPKQINIVDEATLLSSNVAVDNLNNIDSDDDDDCEAIVRLDARPAPKKSISIHK